MPHIIALAGRMASGKSKAAEILSDEYDMEHIEYSSFLYAAMDLFAIPHTRQNIDTWSTFLRCTYAQDAFSRAVQKRLRETTKKWVVLSTIRRSSDLDGIREQNRVHLWYVEADQKARYQRHVSSKRKVGDAEMTFEEFQTIEDNEVQRTIPALKTEAEVVVENNNDFDSFIAEVRRQADKLIQTNSPVDLPKSRI